VGTYYRRAGVPLTEVWIETGTYEGASILAALSEGYPQIRSVEFHPHLAARARERFRAYSQVFIFDGSSPEQLPAMIDAEKSSTFWLDAHFQGGPKDQQDRRYGECPLLKELEVIRAVAWASLPIIAIDDAHMFFPETLPEGFARSEWPTMEDIRDRLLGEYQVDVENNLVWAMPR
jgi:hypothetical protein